MNFLKSYWERKVTSPALMRRGGGGRCCTPQFSMTGVGKTREKYSSQQLGLRGGPTNYWKVKNRWRLNIIRRLPFLKSWPFSASERTLFLPLEVSSSEQWSSKHGPQNPREPQDPLGSSARQTVFMWFAFFTRLLFAPGQAAGAWVGTETMAPSEILCHHTLPHHKESKCQLYLRLPLVTQ